MKQSTFNTLLKKAECQTGTDLSIVGFESSHRYTKISFYGVEKQNYELFVEDFGFERGNKWLQEKPTKDQRQAMQKLIYDRVDKIKEELKRDEYDARNADMTDTHNHIRNNFYNGTY